jgi:hypothetical protein
VLREFNVGRSMLLPLLRRGGTIAPPDACSFMKAWRRCRAHCTPAAPRNIRLDTPVRSIARNGPGFRVVTRTRDDRR